MVEATNVQAPLNFTPAAEETKNGKGKRGKSKRERNNSKANGERREKREKREPREPRERRPNIIDGVPRRALKHLIMTELEEQNQGVFDQLVNQAGAQTDGTTIDVFDVNQPQATNGGDLQEFINKQIHKFVKLHTKEGQRGAQNHGPRSRGGRGLSDAAKKIFDKLMGDFGNNHEFAQKVERLAEEHVANAGQRASGDAKNNRFNYHAERVHNNANKPSWHELRAVCMRKPEGSINLAAGQSTEIELEILNDTYAPYPVGAKITLADKCTVPVTVNTTVEQDVRGKASFTLRVPLALQDSAVLEETYTAMLTFRNPRDKPFGNLIPIEVKCVRPNNAPSALPDSNQDASKQVDERVDDRVWKY